MAKRTIASAACEEDDGLGGEAIVGLGVGRFEMNLCGCSMRDG